MEIKEVSRRDDYQKANFLISSKYKSSLMENKILAISLASISDAKEDKEGSIISEITTTELAKRLGMNSSSGSFYTRLRETAEAMTGRTIGASDPESRSFHYLAAITESKCKDGVFTIKFNSSLNKYIKNLKANYTVLSLATMMEFESVYSFRLYELLRSRCYAPGSTKEENRRREYHINFSLSELKLDMGIVNAELESVKRILSDKKNPDFDQAVKASPEKVLEAWADFKKRALDVAVNEINAKTDMVVSYERIKSGRGGKVTGVEFIVRFADGIESDDVQDVEEKRNMTEDEIFDFVDSVRRYLPSTMKASDIHKICEVANYDEDKIREANDVMRKQSNVGNPTGFMIAAIRDGYKKTTSSFANFEQRDYDWDELEKSILNC